MKKNLKKNLRKNCKYIFNNNISPLQKKLSMEYGNPDIDIEGEPEIFRIGDYGSQDIDIEGEPEVFRMGEPDSPDSDIGGEPEVFRIGEPGVSSLGKRRQNPKKYIHNEYKQKTKDGNTAACMGEIKRQRNKKKKKGKEKIGNNLEAAELAENSTDIDRQKKTELSNVVEDKKSTNLYSGNANIDMRDIERYIREKVTIRRIHDKLYYYDGRIYRPLNKENFLLLLRSRLPKKVENAIPTFHRMEEAYKYLMANPDIQMDIAPEIEDFVKHCIVFSDCIYNVKDDKVYDFSIEYPFLFYVNTKFILESEERGTPNFDNFIEGVSNGSREIEELILQMIGYVTMHSMDAKCFFLLGTAPNSGKSLLGEFIARLFDEEFVGTIPLTELGRRFALGNLWKQAVNVSMDLPTRSLTEQEVSQIKMITGEKRVNTEEKYEPVGTTYLHCKCIYATNGKITLKTYDHAFWDRVVFVPFLHSVPKAEQDRNLLDKLLVERDRIVKKAAIAARNLIDNNFIFEVPKVAKDILNEWSCEIRDSIALFLESDCVIDCNSSVFSCDLYEKYKAFCNKNHIHPETQTLLGKRVNELPGISKIKKRKEKDSNPVWKYEGIGLKSSI